MFKGVTNLNQNIETSICTTIVGFNKKKMFWKNQRREVYNIGELGFTQKQ